MINDFLKNNEVTKCDEKEENGWYVDYRRSTKTYNQLHSRRNVVATQLNGTVKKTKGAKKIISEAMDNMAKIKPTDTLNAIGKTIKLNLSERGKSMTFCTLEIIDFDYFITAKGRSVERYVLTGGRKMKVSEIKKKLEEK